MIVVDCEQGSPEWFRARAGIPTASVFDKIITPTGKASTQADAYANLLLAELMVGGTVDSFEGNAWTERGNLLEDEAADFYQFHHGADIQRVGFVTNDQGTYGCSPDRLVGEDGLLELKCPAPHTHVKYLLDKKLEQTYRPQVQGQLLVTGRKWVDLVSYHPEMPPVIIRAERDEEYLGMMEELLEKFVSTFNNKKQRMIERGYLRAA